MGDDKEATDLSPSDDTSATSTESYPSQDPSQFPSQRPVIVPDYPSANSDVVSNPASFTKKETIAPSSASMPNTGSAEGCTSRPCPNRGRMTILNRLRFMMRMVEYKMKAVTISLLRWISLLHRQGRHQSFSRHHAYALSPRCVCVPWMRTIVNVG